MLYQHLKIPVLKNKDKQKEQQQKKTETPVLC